MPIFDAHCDVLYRLQEDKSLNFDNDPRLHITHRSLKARNSQIQCFALFVSNHIPQEIKFQTVLEMIDIFHEQVIAPYEDMVFVQTAQDLKNLKPGQMGAVLTLEGCDAIGTDLVKLRTLFRSGIRSVGLTWNNANAVADGALESRGAGLSDFGKKVVQENNKYHVWTDVSHLNEKGFWDVMELAQFPIASHSNVRNLCDHPRNLYDDQIRSIVERNGMIGVTFVPGFLNKKNEASVTDILKHIEYFCELGAAHHLGFGSDFDGIEQTPINLQSYYDYPNLIDELQKHYQERLVEGFMYKNFSSAFMKLT